MPSTNLPTKINVTTKKVWLPLRNHSAFLLDRQAMKVGHPVERMHKPPTPLPKPTLPIDWAKSLAFPLLGNDVYGDCMIVAAQHGDNTFTGNAGTESSFDVDTTVQWYLKESGGDNGLNTGQVIADWRNGLPSGPAAKILDSLSINTLDAELVQTAIWLFGGVHFSLSIPDDWYKNFTTGAVWDAPATANSKNGHGVWWNGVNAQGQYHLETWGTYGWITPAGVADCDPSGFVVFSLRWFDSRGMAPNGYSYSQLAKFWTEMGGRQLPVMPAKPTHGDRLLPGQGLLPGNRITSTDGRFKFTMQADGNLVLYGPDNQPLWATNTSGHLNIFDVIFQTDGNLVLYDGMNEPLWASGTNGKPAASVIVQNDGNVVIYDTGNHPLWASNTVVPAQPAKPTHGDRLLPGEGLLAGGSISSADGRFKLTMQGDGNLVLYGPSHQPLWASNTSNHNNIWDAILQTDGNLVVYDAHNHPLWATGTNGKPAAYFVVQNDGNAVLYDRGNHPLWASNTVVPPAPASPRQGDRLLPGQGLMAGRSIISADGRFTLTMQGDGNLVLYGPGRQPLWASNTAGHSNIWDAILQTDGNLVVYDAHNHPLWATGTNGKPTASLIVQNDGNAVLYDNSNRPLWASNTVVPAQPTRPTQGDRLLPGQGLMSGGSLKSADGRYRFIMQADGNLVLYNVYNQPLWASNTQGHSNIWDVILQTDGNLVVYNSQNHPLWASNTNGKPAASLIMQSDGNVVIYDAHNHPLWATNTNQ